MYVQSKTAKMHTLSMEANYRVAVLPFQGLKKTSLSTVYCTREQNETRQSPQGHLMQCPLTFKAVPPSLVGTH